MKHFSAKIWPEEAPPSHAANCQKCELSCQRSRVIWGEGNPDAPIFVVLDNPGAREDREGNAFVCGTRETLQSAADEVGLQMEDLFVTYILKCRPVRAYDKDKARSICMQHMEQQLQQKSPMLAFCLGNVAVQSFLQDPSAEVKHLRGSWQKTRGIPTAVSYHPFAVRRRPNLRPNFIEDWKMLAERYQSLQNPIYP